MHQSNQVPGIERSIFLEDIVNILSIIEKHLENNYVLNSNFETKLNNLFIGQQ